MRCLTERQAGLVARAAELADTFAERAERHDRDNTFPHENFAGVHTGVAAGALAWAVTQLRDHPVDPVTPDTVGGCTILVETARALIHRHAEEVTSRGLFELGVQAGTFMPMGNLAARGLQ